MSRIETMSAEMSIPTLLWLELIMGGGAMKDWCKNELTTIIWLRNDVSPDMIGLDLSAYSQTHHWDQNNLGQSCTYKTKAKRNLQSSMCIECYVHFPVPNLNTESTSAGELVIRASGEGYHCLPKITKAEEVIVNFPFLGPWIQNMIMFNS